MLFSCCWPHASEMDADVIIAARTDATELTAGSTEVLAYATAVEINVV